MIAAKSTLKNFERVVPAEATIAQVVGNEIVLLNLDSGFYYSLNSVGAFIWRHLESGAGIAGLEDRISAEYEVSRDQAKADLDEFIEELREHGLVEAA
ncbi:MAG: PqqD family protein [Hyphomicrobiales bacterium]